MGGGGGGIEEGNSWVCESDKFIYSFFKFCTRKITLVLSQLLWKLVRPAMRKMVIQMSAYHNGIPIVKLPVMKSSPTRTTSLEAAEMFRPTRHRYVFCECVAKEREKGQSLRRSGWKMMSNTYIYVQFHFSKRGTA